MPKSTAPFPTPTPNVTKLVAASTKIPSWKPDQPLVTELLTTVPVPIYQKTSSKKNAVVKVFPRVSV